MLPMSLVLVSFKNSRPKGATFHSIFANHYYRTPLNRNTRRKLDESIDQFFHYHLFRLDSAQNPIARARAEGILIRSEPK